MDMHLSPRDSGLLLRLLPIELTVYILSYLDCKTLRKCSLVTRAWLSASRYHLFKTVKYHFRVQRLMGDGIEGIAHLPLEDLLEFFMSSPSVPSHIRHMKLVMDTVVLRGQTPEEAFPPVPVRLDTLYAILQHTTALSTLTLKSVRFRSSDISAPSLLLRVPAIEHLESIRIDCQGMWRARIEDSVFPILQMVGTVDELVTTVWNSSASFSEPIFPPPSRRDKQLRELHVPSGTIARRLETVADFSHLQLLDITSLEEGEFPWLCGILAMVGSNMRHLHFHLHDHMRIRVPILALDPLAHLDLLDLTGLSNLETLSLSLPVFINLSEPFTETSTFYLYKPSHDFLKRVLSFLPESLRTIGLRVHIERAAIESELRGTVLATVLHPWTEIDSILAARIAGRGLKKVEIDIDAIRSRVVPHLPPRCMTLALPKVSAADALWLRGFTLAHKFQSWGGLN